MTMGMSSAEQASDINPETMQSVQHFEISTRDPARTRAILERLFGWEFMSNDTPGGGTYDTFRMPDGSGGGVSTPLEGQGEAVIPYVNVPNLEDAMARCREVGAEVLVPIQEIPGAGRFFWFNIEGGPALGCWEPASRRNHPE